MICALLFRAQMLRKHLYPSEEDDAHFGERFPTVVETAQFRGELNFPVSLHEKDVLSDGNCCFRVMSVIMFGHEKYYRRAKSKTLAHIAQNFSKYQVDLCMATTRLFASTEAYLSFISNDREWGSFCELLAFSDLLGIRLYLWNGQATLLLNTNMDNPAVEKIFHVLYVGNNHFRCLKVCKHGVDCMCRKYGHGLRSYFNKPYPFTTFRTVIEYTYHRAIRQDPSSLTSFVKSVEELASKKDQSKLEESLSGVLPRKRQKCHPSTENDMSSKEFPSPDLRKPRKKRSCATFYS